MGHRAERLIQEARFALSRGLLGRAQESAAMALSADGPDTYTAYVQFVSGSIEASLSWLLAGDSDSAVRVLQRVFEFPGAYDGNRLMAEPLRAETGNGSCAGQHREAALGYLGAAWLLARESANDRLTTCAEQTARELDGNWNPSRPSQPLVADQVCLLDVSVASVTDSQWVSDLPNCQLVMLAPHWAQLAAPGTSTARRLLRDALLATRRLRPEPVPADLASGADPVLDQLWRLSNDWRLLLVTRDPVQSGAAQRLLELKGPPEDPDLVPFRRELRIVTPASGLPAWSPVVPAAPQPHRYQSCPLPQRPLFQRRSLNEVLVDLTPLAVPIVTTGTVLRTSSGDYRRLISQRLGFGGEGAVYITDRGDVCKAYKPDRATVATRRKLQLMIRNRLDHPHVCWPTELVFHGQEFVGYLMPAARGKLMNEGPTNCEHLSERLPAWTRRDLALLALRVCDVVACLQANNILVGDLSDTNIMVDAEGTPWFIDTDSYQFAGYPSPVGRLPFLHPELLSNDLKNTFRSLEHEWFALATLVFMILFAGWPPYAGAGSDSPELDHRDRIFPYRINKVGDPRLEGRGSLGGPWVFIWSNLPVYVRNAFWAVFREGKEKRAALPPDEQPYDALFWRELMQRYVDDLDHNTRLSREIFPTRYRLTPPNEDEERRTCGRCAAQFNAPKSAQQGHSPRHRSRWTTCKECLNSYLRFPCQVLRPNGKPCPGKCIVRLLDLDPNTRKLCTFHQQNPAG